MVTRKRSFDLTTQAGLRPEQSAMWLASAGRAVEEKEVWTPAGEGDHGTERQA
jgi:hypothetical protein